jgi:hypothetical protein
MLLPEEAAAVRARGREVEAGRRALAAEVGEKVENGEAMVVGRRGMDGKAAWKARRRKGDRRRWVG